MLLPGSSYHLPVFAGNKKEKKQNKLAHPNDANESTPLNPQQIKPNATVTINGRMRYNKYFPGNKKIEVHNAAVKAYRQSQQPLTEDVFLSGSDDEDLSPHFASAIKKEKAPSPTVSFGAAKKGAKKNKELEDTVAYAEWAVKHAPGDQKVGAQDIANRLKEKLKKAKTEMQENTSSSATKREAPSSSSGSSQKKPKTDKMSLDFIT